MGFPDGNGISTNHNVIPHKFVPTVGDSYCLVCGAVEHCENHIIVADAKPAHDLLEALFGGMTIEESKYLAWLLPRINVTGFGGGEIHEKRKFTVARARELFKAKFPNSKWIQG